MQAYWDRFCDFIFQRKHIQLELLRWRSPEAFTMKNVKFNNLMQLKEALLNGKIQADESYIKEKDTEPNPMLGFTVAVDKPEVVRLLLLFNADVNMRDCYGVSPVMRAAALDRSEIFNLLLQTGRADLTLKDQHGLDSEGIAKQFGSVKVLQMIEKYKQSASSSGANALPQQGNEARDISYQADDQGDEYL